SLAFSPDSGRLASGSTDGTALIWDLYAGFRGPAGDPLAPGEFATLWAKLADPDAAAAFAALERLARRPVDTVARLRERLRPIEATSAEGVAAFVRDLDNPQFSVRERATKNLEGLGEAAEPALRQVLNVKPVLEVRRRIERLLERLEASRLREARAIELL